MTALKCKICGEDLHIKEKQSVCECGRCGTRQTIPGLGNEWKINLFNEANELRNEGEFDKAKSVFDLLATIYYNEPEAHWGLFLCIYGINYADNTTTGKKITMCNRASYKSVFKNTYYLDALKYADPLQALIYEEEAKEINKLRKETIDKEEILIISETTKKKFSLVFKYLENRKWFNDYRCIKAVISFFDNFPDLPDAADYKREALNALADLKEKTMKRIEEPEEKLISQFEQEDIRNNYVSKIENEKNNLSFFNTNSDINPENVLDRLLYKLEFLEATTGSHIVFGNYVQSSNRMPEPIEWIVLDKEEDRMLVISRYALDNQKFNFSKTAVTWETCSLRKWLNGTFYNDAFSELEKQLILTSSITAGENPYYSTNQGNNTRDKVFLLSVDELNNYFGSYSERKCKATNYACGFGELKDNYGNCYWWTRTSGASSERVVYVDSAGTSNHHGNCVDDCIDDDYIIAVRPALWINMQY